MLLESVCSRYGYRLNEAIRQLTWPMIYLLMDGWNANNLDGYGLDATGGRPPRPDEKTHEREALAWQLQYEFNMPPSHPKHIEIMQRYDEKQAEQQGTQASG